MRTGSETLTCSAVSGGGVLLIELIEERQIEIWPGPTPNLLKKIREFFFVLLQKFLSFILPGDDW